MKKKNPKNKKSLKEIYFLFPVGFFSATTILLLSITFIVNHNLEKLVHSGTNVKFSNTSFPVLKNKNYPDISAGGAAVMDSYSKQIIYAKNENIRFSPASTTKIMTALVALMYFKSDDILVVNSSEDTSVGLSQGDKFRFEDLLYAMMLPSDNRAAQSIARNYPGGEKEFVNQMNQKAKEWHLNQTHFADPVGLFDDQDFMSPKDLAFLTSIALGNKKLSQVASTKNIIISNSQGTKSYELENLNILLGTEGIVGLKTGHTQQAGDVLATAQQIQAEDGIHNLVIVVMKSEDRFLDTQQILNFLNNNLIYLSNRL